MGTTNASNSSRNTATFVPYFWEAYNEIVEPHSYDKYLVDRWLPDLGPLGFAILKALRRRCYHNPKTGVTRADIEIDIAELGTAVGRDRATVYRELERNEWLKHFVRVQHQYLAEGQGRAPKRFRPHFIVCMDDPIHPADMDRYDDLRAQKERDRTAQETAQGEARKFRVKVPSEGEVPKSQNAIKPENPKSHFAIKGGTKSQNAFPQSHFATPKSQNATDAPYISSVPSDLYTKESIPSEPGQPPSHKCDPPEGEAENADPVASLWQQTLLTLSEQVNIPTFEAHLRPLRPVRQDADSFVLAAPSAFTLEWILKRHEGHIREALEKVLGRAVTIEIVLESK